MPQAVESYIGYNIEQLKGELNYRDHLLLAGIYKVAHPDRGSVPLDELKTRLEFFSSPVEQNNALFVARSLAHARIVGAAMIRLADSPEERVGHIEEIFVRESVRGMSLGKGLLRACVDFADQSQADVVMLDQPPENEAARRLLASMDFMPSTAGLPQLDLSKRA